MSSVLVICCFFAVRMCCCTPCSLIPQLVNYTRTEWGLEPLFFGSQWATLMSVLVACIPRFCWQNLVVMSLMISLVLYAIMDITLCFEEWTVYAIAAFSLSCLVCILLIHVKAMFWIFHAQHNHNVTYSLYSSFAALIAAWKMLLFIVCCAIPSCMLDKLKKMAENLPGCYGTVSD
jgi:hypothetical protein